MQALIYLLILGSVIFFLSKFGRSAQQQNEPASQEKSYNKFRPKPSPMELWVQVYETAKMDEARSLQARLQEEEVQCVLYEQGKKDIHGNEMKGLGVAVPKTAMNLAQKIISRILS